MSNATHAEGHVQEHKALQWFGIGSALAVSLVLALVLVSGAHMPRYGVGVIGAAIGILIGGASNANSSNPGSQTFMEWFGLTCALCGALRCLHVAEILGAVLGDGVGKIFMYFI